MAVTFDHRNGEIVDHQTQRERLDAWLKDGNDYNHPRPARFFAATFFDYDILIEVFIDTLNQTMSESRARLQRSFARLGGEKGWNIPISYDEIEGGGQAHNGILWCRVYHSQVEQIEPWNKTQLIQNLIKFRDEGFYLIHCIEYYERYEQWLADEAAKGLYWALTGVRPIRPKRRGEV